MIEVAFSSSFKKAFKRKIKHNPLKEKLFYIKLETFSLNPFSSPLKTHKLSGKQKHLWSFSIEYDLRVIFYFDSPKRVVFINIGTHEEDY